MEDIYKKIFEQIPGNYSILQANDPDFTVINVTDLHLDNMQLERKQVINKPFLEAYPTDDPEKMKKVFDSFRQVIGSKKSVKFVTRYDVNGLKKYWQLEYAPVIDPNGIVKYITLASVDITRMVEMGLVID